MASDLVAIAELALALDLLWVVEAIGVVAFVSMVANHYSTIEVVARQLTTPEMHF